MSRSRSKLKTWMSLSLIAFLTSVVVVSGLPGLFLFLGISSFELGNGPLWLLRWTNDENGSGIVFNLLPLIIIAAILGLLGLLIRLRRDRSY